MRIRVNTYKYVCKKAVVYLNYFMIISNCMRIKVIKVRNKVTL